MNKPLIDLKDFIKVRVQQLENKNQFVIYCKDNNNNICAFQSYATLIAIWSYSEQKLYINWSMFDYSKTTLKHLKIFVNNYTIYNYENKQQFTKLILNNENIILFGE